MMTTFLLICHPEPRRQRQSGSDRETSRLFDYVRPTVRSLASLGMTERVRSCWREFRQNNLGRFGEILRHPVRRTIGGVGFKTGADANRFDSGVVPAMHIN